MSRRYYLRTISVKSHAARASYPLWYIPAIVIVGALLGMVAYQLSCSLSRMQAQSRKEQSRQTATLKSLPVSIEDLRLQVLNGCGVKGLAKIITPDLRARGFDVRETKNAAHFDYKRSSVIDRTGDVARARTVAVSLGIDEHSVSSEPSVNLVDIDLTLIIGADYQHLNLGYKGSTRE